MRPTTPRGARLLRNLLPAAARHAMLAVAAWSFVYCFFVNHLPFLAPDRSEPCPA